jgi:Cof subfamily protein (haloacid dehalogenase superfamily)
MCVKGLPYIRYAILSNGARVYDYKEQKTINEMPIDLTLTLEIIEALKSSTPIVAIYPDMVILPLRTYIRYLRSWEFWKRLYSRNTSRKMVKEALKSTKIVFSLSNTLKRRKEPVETLKLRFAYYRQWNKAKKILDQFPIEVVTTMGLDLEINAGGVSKAAGLKALCKHLSISKEQVMAAGDSGNDLEMLKHAGFAIVMDNANDEIKEVADKVAPHVKEDGLATALIDLFGL